MSCSICGYSPCICVTPDPCESAQPFCDQCEETNKCTVKLDAECVIYHLDSTKPSKLTNLGLPNDSTLEEILEAIDDLIGSNFNIPFEPVESSSVEWSPGGPAGHAPQAHVKLSATANNGLQLKNDGLYSRDPSGYCKVSVTGDDECDFLENKIGGGDDGIVYNTPVVNGDKLDIVPAIDLAAMMAAIAADPELMDLFSGLVSAAGGGPIPAVVSSINCGGAIISGSYVYGQSMFCYPLVINCGQIRVPYSGGNGGYHGPFEIASQGATGLTAYAPAGSVATGSGELILKVHGTPSAPSGAVFPIILGGQSCEVVIQVNYPVGSIFSLNGAGATGIPNIYDGQSNFGSIDIPYTGGNGGTYAGQTINSTGVTGVGLILAPGNFAVGNGSINFLLVGLPSTTGFAHFDITVGGAATSIDVPVYNVHVENGMNGCTITMINNVPGFSLSTPVNPGEQAVGTHTAFTGTVQVVITGSPVVNPSSLKLYRGIGGSDVLMQTLSVTGPGTYNFGSVTFNVGYTVHVKAITGT